MTRDIKKDLSVKREIRKSPCSACNSTGAIRARIERQCEQCTGKGWIEPSPRNEQVCPSCNGNGTKAYFEESPCMFCEGKGYLISIIEVTTTSVSCKCCEGKGYLEEEFVICARCEGLGVVDNDSPGIKQCPDCDGTGEIDDMTCEQCGGFGIMDAAYLDLDGEEVECPECHGEGSVPAKLTCEKCGGRGSLSMTYERDVTPKAAKALTH